MPKSNPLNQFPPDVIKEICDLSPVGKAALMYQLADDLTEDLDGFPESLSVTTTKWLNSLSMREVIQVLENLAVSLKGDLHV